MKRTLLLSPYSGAVERNMLYARAALLDSISRNEAPLASHLLYPQVLDDTISRERELASDMEGEWLRVSDQVVAYQDYGITDGMELTLRKAAQLGLPVSYRTIEDKLVRAKVLL